MAYLYRFTVDLGSRLVTAIIHAEDDDAAFTHLDVELEKYYLKVPEKVVAILREKKRLGKRSGYILDGEEGE
ncbi:DUF3906 family protein [Bacillus sp. 1P06AnD]|uniref:DUF3906 family protein n=1 Tax=Bacillus sp. 1P06AnD TaxID=3132208 RepID=UPI0039A1D615